MRLFSNISSIFILFILLSANSFADKIIVDKKTSLNSIQQAITIAKPHDEIIIKEGYYAEGNILINKPLCIRGINFPTIDGEGKVEIITVTSDSVIISGIIFKNAGISFLKENAAIRLDEVKDCVIENNKFVRNFFGIYLAKSEKCIIRNNEIEASGKRETSSGNGIHLWYCKNITIQSNKISGHRDGIYLEFVQNTLIKNNYSKNNLRYGLHFMFSDGCTYTENTFEDNGAGVAVMYTKNVVMNKNVFKNNWGPASFGLLLKDISDSKIEHNHFYKNTSGIYIEGCNRIEVQNNIFEANGWAIKLMANSSDNIFTQNDFMNNSFDIATNSKQNFSTFYKNYWNKYQGYDLDKNEIGDVPYHPVKLYSIITEQQQPAIILLHSLFIDILDIAESIFPALTPENLVDNSPLMRRIN
jgi:nitrous oxidase accessory protein